MKNGLGVKTLVLAAGAFIGGLVLGGLQPRAQIRALEEQAFDLKRECAGGSSVSRDLAGLITRGLDDVSSPPSRSVKPAPRGVGESPSGGTPEPVDVPEEPREAVADEAEPTPLEDGFDDGPDILSEEDPLTAARDVMAIRSAQARAALIEDVNPSDDQLREIETTIDRMNDELITLAYDVVDQVRQDGEPDRFQMMQMGADTLDLLVRTEEELLATMTPEQRANLGDDVTDPTAFVDPSVAEVLIELAEIEGQASGEVTEDLGAP